MKSLQETEEKRFLPISGSFIFSFEREIKIVAKPAISDRQIGQGYRRLGLGIRLGSTFPAIIQELQVPESRSRHDCQNHQR